MYENLQNITRKYTIKMDIKMTTVNLINMVLKLPSPARKYT